MATSINMRGKAATSGGAGGGGKSRLRQEWDNLLDHPNPATQQQFEEDYAMADPSSNLFNPRKVLSNRNNLKNYANKKGMPDSRVNAMATKIAKAQMDDFHKHVSQSFEKASSQMARSAQRASETISVTSHRNLLNQFGRISNAQSVIQRVSGGRFQSPVLAANNLSASGARLAALGGLGASADVALISKLGARGSSAAFSGDRRELRKMEKNLDRIASNTGKEVAVLTKSGASPEAIGAKQRILNSVSAQRDAINRARKFSPNAHKLGGGFLGGLGAGELLAAGSTVAAVGGAALGAPFLMSAMARRVIGGASPYMPLSQQMGRFGRAYGGNKLSFMNQIMPKGSKAIPSWMLTSGIMPDQVAGIMGSYGAPISGVNQFKQLMGAVGYANNMPGFGGMSKNTYAGILGQGAAMGLFSPRGERKGVSVSLGGMTGTAVGNTTTDKQYLATFGRVVQSAVKEGMNRSQVVQFMQSSISGAAGGGALSINQRGLLGFGYRMMGSGAPGARTGASVLNFENQLNAGASAVGKMPVQTMMYYQYMKGKTMKQILGSSYGSVMGTKAGRYAISSAQGALSHGSPWFAVQDLAQAAKGHPNLQMRIIDSYMHEMHMPAYMRPQITAALGLTSQSGAIEYGARGAAASPLRGPLSMHTASAKSYGNLLLFESKHRAALRKMEIGSMTSDVASKLKRYGGNATDMLRAYHYGSLIPGKGYRTADTEMKFAQSMGWRGNTTFVKSRRSDYRKALLAKGVPPKDVNTIIQDSEKKNINPLLVASIPGAVEDQSWSLIARNQKSSAFGLGQLTSATAQTYLGNNPRQMALYNRGVALSGKAASYMNSPNANASIRGANATAQMQGLYSSRIIFETLATNMSGLSNAAKMADTAIGNLAQSATHAAAVLASGHDVRGINDLISGTGPKDSFQLYPMKNP